MQHVGIQSEDEWGKLIDRSDLNFADILNPLDNDYHTMVKKYPWVMSVAPYADTTLNYLQRPYLLAELEILKDEPLMEGLSETIDGISDFIRGIDDFHYVKFLGD